MSYNITVTLLFFFLLLPFPFPFFLFFYFSPYSIPTTIDEPICHFIKIYLYEILY
jgi:hypothetical protein